MTLPVERYFAIRNTERFLYDLTDPKKTPKIPKAIRDRAFSLLKHYPSEYYMDEAAEQAPSVFAKNFLVP